MTKLQGKRLSGKLISLATLPLLLTGCGVAVATFTPTPAAFNIATLSATPALAATTTPLNFSPTATSISPTPEVPPTFTPVMAFTPTPQPFYPIETTANSATMPIAITSDSATITATTVSFPTGVTLDAEEQKFTQLLNAYRQANGVSPLTLDAHLSQSSLWLAKDMATKNYVSHIDSLKRDIPTRIHAFGYPGLIVGENIAGGFANAQDNLNIWESDQIHKDNLLGKYYKKVGVARYYNLSSLNKWYWVLDLGG